MERVHSRPTDPLCNPESCGERLAPTFALGVQWHAEYDPQRNPINRKLFEAFGEAMVAKQRAAA